MPDYRLLLRDNIKQYTDLLGTRLSRLDDHPALMAIVALHKNNPVGILTFEYDTSICEIYDFFVPVEARMCGIGRMLYSHLIATVYKNKKITEFRLTLKTHNSEMESFLQKLGFELDRSAGMIAEFPLHRVSESNIIKHCRHVSCSSMVSTVSEYNADGKKVFTPLWEKIPKANVTGSSPAKYDPDYSIVFEIGGTAKGFILIKVYDSELAELSYLYMHEGSGVSLVPMIKEAADRLLKDFGGNIVIRTYLTNEEASSVATKLVPNATLKPVIRYRQPIRQINPE